MAVVLNIKGTSVTTFQIGKQGPLIKKTGDVVEFRDKDGAAFADVTIKTLTTDGVRTPTVQAEDETNLLVKGGDGVGVAIAGDLILEGGDGSGSFASGDVVLRAGSGGTADGKIRALDEMTLLVSTVANLPAGEEGSVVYCSNGDAGSPCLAVHNGTDWKVVALGATVSAV